MIKGFDKVAIIGGGGHVGLPLALSMARAGVKVIIIDKDKDKLKQIAKGIMPFKEKKADKLLKNKIVSKNLELSFDESKICEAKFIIIVIGTPLDEDLKPDTRVIDKVFKEISPYLIKEQIIILRSTVYPGTSEKIQQKLNKLNKKIRLCYCPERIAEGKAIEEIKKLPQIVSGFDRKSIKEVKELFLKICPKVIEVSPKEAEVSKLFSNAWRYIKFAVANNFYQIAIDNDLDWSKIYQSMTIDYPRNKDLPKAGFASGPCLFKDTVQLNSFLNDSFSLGKGAIEINQKMPERLIKFLDEKYQLKDKRVGILGMAFKAESDDSRDSLAYELKKVAEKKSKKVYCSDPFIKDKSFVDSRKLVSNSDIVIIGCPHRLYAKLDYKKKLVINIWK